MLLKIKQYFCKHLSGVTGYITLYDNTKIWHETSNPYRFHVSCFKCNLVLNPRAESFKEYHYKHTTKNN